MDEELKFRITTVDEGASSTVEKYNETISKTSQKSEETSGKFNKLSEAADQNQKSMSGVEKSAIAVGAAYAALKIERMIAGWMDLDAAQQKVDNSLRQFITTTGRYSQGYIDRLTEQARAIQALTGINRDEIEQGEARLQIYDKISNDLMPRVIQDMVDLSAVVGDNKMASELLGKASEGMTESFKRYGIVIDDDVFKTEGFTGVLDALEKKIKGQAEAMAEGAGKWDILKAEMKETKKEIGGLINDITTGTGAIDRFSRGFKNLADYIHDARDGWRTLVQMFGGEDPLSKMETDNILWQKEADINRMKDSFVNQMQSFTGPLSMPSLDSQAVTALAAGYDAFGLSIASLPEKISAVTIATNNMNAAGMKGIVDSQQKEAEDAAEKIAKLNENLADKINKLSLSGYDYKKLLINQEYDDTIKQHGDIIKATQLKNLELEKLDKDYLAKKSEWVKLYSEQAATRGTSPVYSLPGEFTPWEDLLKQVPNTFSFDATLNSAKQSWADFDQIYYDNEKTQEKIDKEHADFINKQLDEYENRWRSVNETITSSFNDAIVRMTEGGKDPFTAFFTSIETMAIHTFSQQFMQPLIQPFANAFSSLLVPQGFVGPLTPTQTFMQTAAPYLGAGMLGYGIGGGWTGALGGIGGYAAGTSLLGGMSIFSAGGALAGLAGPLGMLGGVAISAMADDLLSRKDEIKIPSYDLLWETVDGQIRNVAQSWENMHPDQQVIAAANDFVKQQLDFFKKLAVVSGTNEIPSFNFELSGTGSSISSILQEKKIEGTIASAFGGMGQIQAIFGPAFKNVFKETFIQSFMNSPAGAYDFMAPQGLMTQYLGWKFDQLASMNPDDAMAAFQGWMGQPNMFSPVGRPGIMANTIFNLWQSKNPNAALTPDIFPQLEQFASTVSPGLLTLGQTAFSGTGTGAWSPESLMAPWQDLLSGLQDQLNDLYPLITMGMGDAFANSLASPGFDEFKQGFSQGVFDAIKKSLTQAYIEQGLLPQVMAPFMSSDTHPALGNVISQYSQGQITFDQAKGYLNVMTGEFKDSLEGLKPIWEMLNTTLTDLSTALGLNTTATQSNTDAVLGPVNSFLSSLDTGPLAPVQSIARMKNTENSLYAAALADPSQFSSYANFMTSNMLPYLQSTSTDYIGDVSGIRAGVENMPWVRQAQGETPTAESIGLEVGKAVAPMLLDLKESLGPVTIQVIVDGQVIKSQVIKSLDDSAVVQKEKDRS